MRRSGHRRSGTRLPTDRRQRAPVDELWETGKVGFGTRPRIACAASMSQLRGDTSALDAALPFTGHPTFGPSFAGVAHRSATARFTWLTSARASISISRHTDGSALTWRATMSGLLQGWEKSAKWLGCRGSGRQPSAT